MPGHFIFGIPNYFNFTFRARPNPPPASANGTTDVESFPSHDRPLASSTLPSNRDLETSSPNGMRKLDSSSSHGIDNLGKGSSPSGACGTLGKLPTEIRTMIYVNVLTCRRHIKKAHKCLGPHPPIQAVDCLHLEEIDAALLRTCKAVYDGAVGILYGMNIFRFRKPKDIKKFAHFGLKATTFGPSSLNYSPFGRFTMVRVMHLRLANVKDDESDLKKVWSFWSDVFDPSEKPDQLIGFPALEWFLLDFTEWVLFESDAWQLRVKPFLRVFRPTGGLRHLTLIGVKHEQNIRDFKHGFVKQGGTFRPDSSKDKQGRKTIVTHENLPEVSMCVRAIVEKDRASRAILQSGNAALADKRPMQVQNEKTSHSIKRKLRNPRAYI